MAVADVEKLAEEYEAEKPGRRLGPIHEKIVTVACAGLSSYAIYWVLNPVPAQRYRTSFLLVALALTFLVYRGWGKRDGGRGVRAARDHRLAARARLVVALGYTLVDFDEFVRRAAQPNDLDIAFGVTTILLVLEATRRTVGWILPAVVIGFLALRLLRRRAADEWDITTRATASPHRRADLHGPAGDLRRPARRRGHLHHPVHDLRRRARVLGRRPLLPRPLARGHRPLAYGAGPHDRAGRLPARHRVGLGRRDHGHPRHRHLADPAARRLPAGGRRRRARGLGHRRDPVAADPRRGRVHHRRVPRRVLPDGPALRGDPVAALLPGDPARDRDRRPPLRHHGGRRRDAAGGPAAAALRLPLLVAVRDRGLPGARPLAVPRGALRDGARVRAVVPGPRAPDDARGGSCEALAAGARRCCRWRRRARRPG